MRSDYNSRTPQAGWRLVTVRCKRPSVTSDKARGHKLSTKPEREIIGTMWPGFSCLGRYCCCSFLPARPRRFILRCCWRLNFTLSARGCVRTVVASFTFSMTHKKCGFIFDWMTGDCADHILHVTCFCYNQEEEVKRRGRRNSQVPVLG